MADEPPSDSPRRRLSEAEFLVVDAFVQIVGVEEATRRG